MASWLETHKRGIKRLIVFSSSCVKFSSGFVDSFGSHKEENGKDENNSAAAFDLKE